MTNARLASAYFGGLTHIHTRLSNHPGHHESNLTIKKTIQSLTSAGLVGGTNSPISYLAFNEHTSESGAPRLLPTFSFRDRQIIHQTKTVHGTESLGILLGLEVSCLPSGKIDAAGMLTTSRPFIIASRHALPEAIEHDPSSIVNLLAALCDHPKVVSIGHPLRNLEQITDLDWTNIFAYARDTGTAIEVNYNSFIEATNEQRASIWPQWLTKLADSAAPITVGSDIHTTKQLQSFITLWGSLDTPSPNILRDFIAAVNDSGITDSAVITANYTRMTRWLATDKKLRNKINLER